MTGVSDPPFVGRALGAAIESGAAVASLAFAVGRPMVRSGIRSACETTVSLRRASTRAATEGARSALEGARPLTRRAMTVKDQARRRAVGMLPPEVGEVVEAWRNDFIEAEKAVYYGGRAAFQDMEPRIDRACAAGTDVAERAFDVWADMIEVGLGTALKVGEAMQAPRPAAPTKNAPPRRAPKRKTRA